MTDHFAFDGRVAQRYNRQRAHPPDVSANIGQAIAAEVGGEKRVLEIGVGTGRIAWPMVRAGCQVVGMDLSAEMLSEVFDAQAEVSTFRLLQGDMHQLPFGSNHFDAVVVVHVLHLAKDSAQVLSEIARVLRPSGVFMQGSDWVDPMSVTGRFRDELRSWVTAQAPNMRPPSAGLPIWEQLRALGGIDESEQTAAEWTTYLSPAERLDDVVHKRDSESWFLPPHMFTGAVDHLKQWSTTLWPDLTAPQPIQRRFQLHLLRGSW